MAWSFNDNGTINAWAGAGDQTTDAFAVTTGDLIVVGAIDMGSGGGISAVTDSESNTYLLGEGTDYGQAGSTGALTTAYCINATGNASMQVTVTYTGGTQRKCAIAASYTPDGGETVSFDKFMYGDGTGTTLLTNEQDTTGDDEVCAVFHVTAAGKVVSTEEIPNGTAATGSFGLVDVMGGYYGILSSTASGCEAETVINVSQDWSIQAVCFKSTAAGDLSINVSDTIGTVEALTDQGSGGKTSLYELSAIIENINSKISGGKLTVQEIAAITEIISSRMSGDKLNTYEIMAISENIALNLSHYNISISDIIGIIENINSIMSGGKFSVVN